MIDGICYTCGTVMFADYGEPWLGTVCTPCVEKALGLTDADF